MHRNKLLTAIGLCVSLTGCQLAFDATENVVFETCLCTNALTSKVHYRFLAKSAWDNYCGQHPDKAGSGDFACGFKKGYSDFLEYGSCCTQRCLPPMRYWKLRNENPEGRMAAKLWQEGYREGKAAAEASGLRPFIDVPFSDAAPLAPPKAPPSIAPTPPSSSGPAHPSVLPGPPMMLPPVPPPLPPSRPSPELPVPRSLPDYESKKPPEGAKEITKPAVVPAATSVEVKPKNIVNAVPRLPAPSPFRAPASVTVRAKEAVATPASLAYGVGLAAMQGGNVEAGLCWLQSALKEDPNYAPAHKALMEYYQKVGDLSQAAVHRTKAEMLAP